MSLPATIFGVVLFLGRLALVMFVKHFLVESAVYVDDTDAVWLSDFNANAILRFDPVTETFTEVPLPHDPGDVRQILGRPGEVWGAESSADHLVVVRPSWKATGPR